MLFSMCPARWNFELAKNLTIKKMRKAIHELFLELTISLLVLTGINGRMISRVPRS